MREATWTFSRVKLLLPSIDRKKVSVAKFEQATLPEIPISIHPPATSQGKSSNHITRNKY